jgi:hypothetical protein
MSKKQQRNIMSVIIKVYYAYTGVKLRDKGKSWDPDKVCYVCVQDLRKWSKGKNKGIRYGVPMIQREPKNHIDDCYFCCCDVKGYISKNKKLPCTRTFHSALRPFVYGPEVPVPQPPEILEDASTNNSDSGGYDEEF